MPVPPHSAPQAGRLFLGLALLVPLAFAVLHYWIAPPVMSHDSAMGWQTWRSMMDGAGWNSIVWPDPTDLSRSAGGYLTWWSPGQYLPFGILTRLGLSLGAAMTVTSLLGAWSLAAGLWRLGLAFSLTPLAASVAAFVAAATWQTLLAFGFFIGGEVALLAVWPWLILGAWQLRDRPVGQVLGLPLLFLIGSYAKLSFGLYAAGLLLFLWLEAGRENQWRLPALIRSGFRLALAGALYLGAWYWLHLRHGATPANVGATPPTLATSLAFAFSGTWFSTVGFGSVLGRFGLGLDGPRAATLLPVLGIAAVSGAIATFFFTQARSAMSRLAGAVALTSAGLIAALVWRGAAISLEDRHFRPAGVLLLAAVAAVAAGAGNRAPVWIARSFLTVAVVFGVAAGVQRIGNLRDRTVPAGSHVAALNLDREALAFLETRDQPGRLICLTDVMHLPLLARARVMIADAAGNGATAWHGRVPELTVMVPAGRDARALRGQFADYADNEWRLSRQGEWQFWSVDAPGQL